MKAPPSGTITFLFTDIEGSTQLWQKFPALMRANLARHDLIMRQAIESNGGHVFKTVGDAFCAAFRTGQQGAQAAVDAQIALQREAWDEAVVKVRMGLHTGTAEERDGDYFGPTLNRVARLMAVGHGGQILLSQATQELICDGLSTGVTLRDMGERRLKDLVRPERIFQLNAPGLVSDFPPLRTLEGFRHNLPAQLTSFIGREKEIAELKRELNDHNLVTLTGSGGTGKTRLSLQLAAEVMDSFPDGVWFVELAPLADPDLIPQTILSAIGIQEPPDKPTLEILKEYLPEKKLLIVLDNCEHLIEASAKTTNTLLSAAPGLKILASSREALGVKGELSYPVPSLSLPDPKHLPSIEQLRQYEAVRLFIDRALLAAPHFAMDEANAHFIAKICHRIDGIPLAIELAAARMKIMSAEQIFARLDDRFRLLTGGARTALPRQQTLRATIDWSYDILSDYERLLLCRLSVFAGGWTLEAAEEVCVGQDDSSAYDVLDLIAQLVNKSLVIVMEDSQSGETRYRMLETIRQYAREKLLDAGGSEIIRQQHLVYFVKLAKEAEPELYRSNQVLWFNRLGDELDNLRTALEWSLISDAGAGLEMAAIPWRFWQARGYFREQSEWLAALLERHNKTDALHVRGLLTLTFCILRQGNFTETIKFAEQSVRMARALSDHGLEARSLSLLGVVTLLQGNVAEGVPLLEQGLAIFRALGDKIGQALTLEWLSYDHNSPEHAIAFSKESLSLYRQLGDLTGIANALVVLARLTLWIGDFSSPAPWLEEALSIYRQLGDQAAEVVTLVTFGALAHWQGAYQIAIAHFEEAILLSEKIGDHYQNLWSHIRMAHAFLRQGDIRQARTLFVDSIENKHMANFPIALVYAVEGLASLYVNQEQLERAARLFAWSDAMREKIGDHRPSVEQASVERDLAVIHSKVDEAEFADLLAEGNAMTVEQTIALALEEADD